MEVKEYKDFSELSPEQIQDLMEVSAAARIRDVQIFAIYDLIRRKRLSSIKIAGKIFVFKSEIEDFEKQKTGKKKDEK